MARFRSHLNDRPLWQRPAWVLATLLTCLDPTSSVQAADARNPEADLNQLRSRIDSARKRIQADTVRRDALAGELQAAEVAVQSARDQAADLRRQRQASERKLTALRTEQSDTEREIAAQRGALGSELRLAYMNGRAEHLKLLLNQQNPSELGRMLAYYGYFGRARAARIQGIAERLTQLQVLAEDIESETRRLAELEQAQQAQVRSLADARANRAKTLAAIQITLRSRNDQLKKLQREAATLERLLDDLRSAVDEFPVLSAQPFAKTQGRLPWPVKGKLRARFGQPRGGGPLKWQGVLIAGTPGSQVRAPFHGRVVYADWLAGMGLLVVLDHGGGYLSLYGQNEQLFRKVGDMVAPGDLLGALGDDAANAELYLEIRKGKQALNPERWLRKP